MGLNDGFLTDGEKQKFADHHDDELDGNLVVDNIPPEELFANADTNDFPILLDDVKLITSMESQLADLAELKEMLVQAGGIDRSMAASMEHYVPELLQLKPINSFSTHLSQTNYTLSIEEIDKKRVAIYAGLISAILALCYKIYKWLFGKSGDGENATSVASPDAVVSRSEQASSTAQITAVVDEGAAIIANRHRGDAKLEQARREAEQEIAEILDNSTEGRIIGLIGHNRDIQEIYRKLLGSAPVQFDEIAKRLEKLKRDVELVKEALAEDNSRSMKYTEFLNHLRSITDQIPDLLSGNRNTDNVTPGRNLGINALVPTIGARSPMRDHPREMPEYILITGFNHNQEFVDINTVAHFLKDPSGMQHMVDAYRPSDMSSAQVFDDIVHLAESAILKEFMRLSNTLEPSMSRANEELKTTSDTLKEYLEKMPVNAQQRLTSKLPGIQAQDSTKRDLDGESDEIRQEPPTTGAADAGTGYNGEVARQIPGVHLADPARRNSLNPKGHDIERYFRFLENELRGKGREIANWGAAIGIIAKHVSIINIRLVGKIASSKGQTYAKMRQLLLGDEERRDSNDAMMQQDAMVLSVMEMVIHQTRAGMITLAEKPRAVSGLRKFVETISKISHFFTSDGQIDPKKFDEYQHMLSDMADTFEQEIDGKVAARLRRMIKLGEAAANDASGNGDDK